ncbi:uncharacterized protein LOC121629697 [Melanotaenia boesemani]|uniref:uncharacterized protein LOC121629697 n=1 Tax=Melanotaenia boesemani TaxID=1250792 RepID=UPI001C0495A3|nr:uncharacterized protein LOC121629697 [Melanotaenia boesemani]
MSSEKGTEVVGCDASIMKNVWEIRVREYGMKLQLEQDRIEKSSLLIINQDWENRVAAKTGGHKRRERKPKHQAETQPDNNVWKSKPQTPRIAPARTTASHGGSAPLGRPGFPSKGFSAPTPAYKDKKGQDKSLTRLQFLMHITQTQPSTIVWGKAWKYNKSLPPAEGSTAGSDWGQCWMFATHQPPSGEGKHWSSEPYMMDPHSLHFWRKLEYRMVKSQRLDFSLPAEEWQVSWQRADKMKEDDVTRDGGPKAGYFTKLMESQRHNESLYSSEWSDSWQSTKPANEQDHHIVSNEGLMNESTTNKQGNEGEMSSEWEECWKLMNHHGTNVFKPWAQKALGPRWTSSWRAATTGFNNHNNSDYSQGSDDQGKQIESHFNNVINVPCSHNYKNLHQNFCKESESPNEWNKSWQITKTNSKPSEEIDKVLKAPPPKIDTAGAQSTDKALKEDVSMPPDPRYEQLKHGVMHQSKSEFPQSKLLLLQQLQKLVPLSDWKESWKMIKHRMRTERRKMKADPLKIFGESEKGRDKKPTLSEWKDSWKYTCKPLHQEPERWQQGWSTTNQIRVNWERHQNEFAPVEFPKNGPTGERIWGESWKFTRRQHRSEPGQRKGQTSDGKSNVHSHHPYDSQEEVKHTRAISDWQQAWMVSETQFRHDKPSLSQWREAWKWSIYHTLPWTELAPRDQWVDELAEIQHCKKVIFVERAKAKMSRSIDKKMFRERYPEKEWSSSWNAESVLQHQPSYYGSSGVSGQGASNRSKQQQHPLASEHGSVWGRSFRFANPMPKLNQPWLKSCPNPAYYLVIWSRGTKTQDIKSNLSSSTANFKIWSNSYQFLQGANGQTKGKRKSAVPSDPREIFTKMTRARKPLYSNLEKEMDKQLDKKWAGCHLWGKAQPRPKKCRGLAKKLKPEDKDKDKFFEKWIESWKFLVRPENLNKRMSFKPLSGWDESWTFLFQSYVPMLDPRGK